METTPPIRVVLANDSELVAHGLRSMLEPYRHRIEVVGEVLADSSLARPPEDFAEADELLLDTYGLRRDGLHAAKLCLDRNPPLALVVYSDESSERRVLEAVQLGVRGYLLKSDPAAELVWGIERVAAGHLALSRALGDDVIARAQQVAAGGEGPGTWAGASRGLTRREGEVLDLLAAGNGPGEIARQLTIGHETVRSHLKHVYGKLGVNDRAAAVAVAWTDGLVDQWSNPARKPSEADDPEAPTEPPSP